MEDKNNTKPGLGGIEGEQSSTTRLLKKRTEKIEEESPATTPLTHRLADMDLEEEKKKPSKLFIFGMAALALLLIGGVVLIYMSSQKGNIFSGGGADINTYGSDSMDADIVEGQSGPIQMPVDKPATTDRPGTTAATPGSQPAATPGAPATPPVGITSTEREEPPTIPIVRQPVKTEPAPEPKPTQAAKPDQPTSAPATADAGPKNEPKPAPASGTPASSAPAMTLEQGFNLEKQSEVKEGDLVPMTDDVIKPVIVNRAQAKMPPLAKQLRKTGQVIVRVMVDENGNVGDAKLVSEAPKGFGFGQASLEAAQMFKYKPARKGSIRVKVWDTIFFTFR